MAVFRFSMILPFKYQHPSLSKNYKRSNKCPCGHAQGSDVYNFCNRVCVRWVVTDSSETTPEGHCIKYMSAPICHEDAVQNLKMRFHLKTIAMFET